MKKVRLKKSGKNSHFHDDTYESDSKPNTKKRLKPNKRIRKQDLDFEDDY